MRDDKIEQENDAVAQFYGASNSTANYQHDKQSSTFTIQESYIKETVEEKPKK